VSQKQGEQQPEYILQQGATKAVHEGIAESHVEIFIVSSFR
jgi:hypothetical protein